MVFFICFSLFLGKHVWFYVSIQPNDELTLQYSIEWSSPRGKIEEFEMPRCVNIVFDEPNKLCSDMDVRQIIGIRPLTVSFMGNNQKYVTRTQIPLVLSYATTEHKVQGLTLPKAACDLGPHIFTGGMAYVALSRISTLND